MKYLNHSKICHDLNSSAMVFYDLFYFAQDTLQNPHKYGCPQPCNSTTFTVSVDHSPKTSIIDPLNRFKVSESYVIAIFYVSTDVEEKTVTLLFDLGTMISATGGNLGLTLGFSVLSILLGITNHLTSLFIFFQQKIFPKRLAKDSPK